MNISSFATNTPVTMLENGYFNKRMARIVSIIRLQYRGIKLCKERSGHPCTYRSYKLDHNSQRTQHYQVVWDFFCQNLEYW